MRRIITTILLLLALGTTTTIAISWAIAIDYIQVDTQEDFDGFHDRIHPVSIHQGLGIRTLRAKAHGTHFADRDYPDLQSPLAWSLLNEDWPSTRYDLIERITGWPCLALKTTLIAENAFCISPDMCLVRDGIRVGPAPYQAGAGPLGMGEYEHRFLPTRPLWPGFITNMLIYSAAWALLVSVMPAIHAVRAYIRSRHSRCVACGYILRVDTAERCPECGKVINSPNLFLPSSFNPALLVSLALLMVIVGIGWGYASRRRPGPEPIHFAALEGNLAKVRRLINEGVPLDAPVNSADPWVQGSTPLMWAAVGGRADVIEYLVTEGAQINATTTNNMQAIHWAASHSRADGLLALIDAGANINARSFQNRPPIHCAVFLDVSQPCLEALIENGVDPNESAGAGPPILAYALMFGHQHAAEYLLENGAVMTSEDAEFDAMTWAMQNGTDAMQLLIDHGYDCSASAVDLIATAADRSNPVELIRYLVIHGAQIDPDTNPRESALADAFAMNNIEAFRLLLDLGADPNRRDGRNGQTMFHTLMISEKPWTDPKWFELLDSLDLELDVLDDNGKTALRYRLEEQNVPAVKCLLKLGANPLVKCGDGWNALECAEEWWGDVPPSDPMHDVVLLLRGAAEKFRDLSN